MRNDSTPQVETREISDSDLDTVSGGLSLSGGADLSGGVTVDAPLPELALPDVTGLVGSLTGLAAPLTGIAGL